MARPHDHGRESRWQRGSASPRSLDDYWSKTRNDIVPGIGKHRLDRLRPEHLDELYLSLHKQGHAPSHVLRVHRIISRALKIAERRQIIGLNAATLIDAPPQRTALGHQHEPRRALGEALGLRRAYVDLVTGSIKVWWQLQRLG